ncbi:MAG: hypothetical protein WAZ60_03350 [Desulfosalsimonadaceae bacterium]
MKPLKLSKEDLMLLKRDLNFPWVQIVLFIIILTTGGVFYFINYHWLPLYLFNINENLNFNKVICSLRFGLSVPAFFYFSLLTGLLMGNILSHIARANILKKLDIDSYLEEVEDRGET